MKTRTIGWSIIIAVTAFFTGCELIDFGDKGSTLSPSELRLMLVDKNWELRTVLEDGTVIYSPELDSMYTLHFSAGGQFAGHEICNHCGGEYHIDDNSNLVIKKMACTEMACYGYEESVPFTNVLVDKTHAVTMRNNQLYISVENDSMEHLYIFSEYLPPKISY